MEAGPEEIRGKPPRSGSNKARSSALWRRKVAGVRTIYGTGNKGGTAYFTSLAIEILQGTFVHVGGNPAERVSPAQEAGKEECVR